MGDPKENQNGKEPKDDGESKGKLSPEEIKQHLDKILQQEKIDFSGAIEISGTVDEETGGYGCVAFLSKKGFLTSSSS